MQYKLYSNGFFLGQFYCHYWDYHFDYSSHGRRCDPHDERLTDSIPSQRFHFHAVYLTKWSHCGSVSLTFSIASGLPTGVTPVFTSNPCNTNCTATVSFSATSTATVGTTTVVVQGTGGGVTRTIGLSLAVYPLSVLGLDCAYGSNLEGVAFPASVTTSAPYATPDFDGTLDTSCQATYLADTDNALHPLVSDNPTAIAAAGAGGGVTIDVIAHLNPVTTINGFDISLKYDTSDLNAALIDQSGLAFGGFNLPPGSIRLVITKVIDNSAGTVRLAMFLANAPQSGDVELFRVRFDIVGSGNSSINIINDTLTSPAAIPHTTQSPTSLDTQSIYDVLNAATLGFQDNFTFTPSLEVPSQSLTFSATSAFCPGCTAPFTYNWDFGVTDAGTFAASSTGQTVTITAPPPVVYRVELQVTDSASRTFILTRDLPLALLESPVNSALSVGVPATNGFAAKWLGGVVTATSGYVGAWRFCPGTALSTIVCSSPVPTFTQTGTSITNIATVASVTYHFAGIYNDTLTVHDASNTEQQLAFTQNQLIAVFYSNVTGSPAAYTVHLNGNTTSIAAGKTIAFTTSSSYDGTYPAGLRSTNFKYTWDFGDGSARATTQGNVTSIAHTYTAVGSYTVNVVAQETDSRAVSQIEETGSLGLTVASILCPVSGACSLSFTPGSVTVGQTVAFTAAASGGLTPYVYSWSFGDDKNATGTMVNHTYNSSGNFTVTLTVTDSSGQTHAITRILVVSASPFSFVDLLTSPVGLGAIVAVIAVGLGGAIFYSRRRRQRLSPNPSVAPGR